MDKFIGLWNVQLIIFNLQTKSSRYLKYSDFFDPTEDPGCAVSSHEAEENEDG